MRQALTRHFYLLVIVLLSLTGCGSATTQSATPTAAPPLPIPTAGTPIETPTPRPTDAELVQLKAVANRLDVMYRAAQALHDPQILSSSDWRNKVNTQITILRGSKQGIDTIGMPERYQTPRLIEILGGCMVVADRLSAANLQRSTALSVEGLERCVNGLREMAFVYTEYTK